MSARKHRSGFTLVELLVVITIIGMLVALLLPAVQNAREAGRRATCINNLKNITLATQNFESSKQRFPGWREHLGISQGSQGRQVKASWAFMILPQLDRNDLYRAYTKKVPEPGDVVYLGNPPVPTESLEIFTCPSDPPEQAGGTPISYAVNAGVPDRRLSSEDDAMVASGDAAANGVFHDADPFYNASSAIGPNGQPLKPKKLVKLNTSSISANDGSATTIMFAERVEARNWTDIGAAGGGQAPAHDPTQTVLGEHFTGVTWMPVPSLPSPASDYDINGIKPPHTETDKDVSTYRYHDVRPSSQHPGIVIVSFVDGHVTTLNETTQYSVYAQLMTPNGSRAVNCDGAVDQPFRLTTPLNEADFK